MPRIRKAFLARPRENGGLALPNLMHYYWAANPHALSYWTSDIPEHEAPVWLLMEQHSSSPNSLAALACALMPICKHYHTNNPVIGGSLRIWSQLRVHFGHKKLLLSSPILANPFFPPSLIDPAFKLWKSRGLICVRDFFKDGLFISFDYLKVRFDIPNTHFFRYPQIRNYIKTCFSPSLVAIEEDWIHDCVNRDPQTKGFVSFVYDTIQNVAAPSLHHVKTKWEEDLNLQIPDVTRQLAMSRVNASSICIRYGLIQLKIFHRLHLSRSRLAKLYPNIDPRCERRHQTEATLRHMFWSCSRLSSFWLSIFVGISCVCKKRISPNPIMAIFGTSPEGITLSTNQANMVAFVTLLARKLILVNWRSPKAPTHKYWPEEVLAHLKLEKLRYSSQGCTKKLYNVWQPFMDYFNKDVTLTLNPHPLSRPVPSRPILCSSNAFFCCCCCCFFFLLFCECVAVYIYNVMF